MNESLGDQLRKHKLSPENGGRSDGSPDAHLDAAGINEDESRKRLTRKLPNIIGKLDAKSSVREALSMLLEGVKATEGRPLKDLLHEAVGGLQGAEVTEFVETVSPKYLRAKDYELPEPEAAEPISPAFPSSAVEEESRQGNPAQLEEVVSDTDSVDAPPPLESAPDPTDLEQELAAALQQGDSAHAGDVAVPEDNSEEVAPVLEYKTVQDLKGLLGRFDKTVNGIPYWDLSDGDAVLPGPRESGAMRIGKNGIVNVRGAWFRYTGDEFEPITEEQVQQRRTELKRILTEQWQGKTRPPAREAQQGAATEERLVTSPREETISNPQEHAERTEHRSPEAVKGIYWEHRIDGETFWDSLSASLPGLPKEQRAQVIEELGRREEKRDGKPGAATLLRRVLERYEFEEANPERHYQSMQSKEARRAQDALARSALTDRDGLEERPEAPAPVPEVVSRTERTSNREREAAVDRSPRETRESAERAFWQKANEELARLDKFKRQ